MDQLKTFSELGIASEDQLTGKKIGISHVLNKQVIVKAFRIDPSKYPNEGNGKRLTLQIEVDNEEHVIFTSSIIIQDQVQRVPEGSFPFKATIIPLIPRGYKLV